MGSYKFSPRIEHPTAWLDLPGLRALKAESDDEWWLVYAIAASAPQCCPKCRASSGLHRFGKKNQYFEDCPRDGLPVRICVSRQRYKCLNCHQSFYEPIQELDDTRRASRRLVRFIAKEALRCSFSRIAEDCGLHERSVRRIAHDFFRALEAVVHLPTPRWLGIDEVKIKGTMRVVLTNLKDRKLYEILPDCNSRTITACLRRMPGRETIEVVCMDFYPRYRKLVRACLPGAVIVVDKFHIIQLAHKAIDRIRRRVKKRKSGKIQYDSRILRKREYNLSVRDQEALRRWESDVPEFATAFALKEQYCQVWEAPDEATARAFYEEWKCRRAKALPWAFRELLNTISRRENEVFACVAKGITNGYAERINGVIKDLNRSGRRVAFKTVRAKLLYTYGYARVKNKVMKPTWRTDKGYYKRLKEESEDSPVEVSTARASTSPTNVSSTIQELAQRYVMVQECGEDFREDRVSYDAMRSDNSERVLDPDNLPTSLYN